MTPFDDTLRNRLSAILGASAQFYPGKKPKLDDYYEAYLWAETLFVADEQGWQIGFINAGASNNQFNFRMGPGLITSKGYTHAEISKGGCGGELHIGIRVHGGSGTLHEFDVLGLDRTYRTRGGTGQPKQSEVKLHIEAKFHQSDLSLGVGREIVGLGADCPDIEPFLVAKNKASKTVRPLIKHFGGHFVEQVFPGDSGVDPYFHNCVRAALRNW